GFNDRDSEHDFVSSCRFDKGNGRASLSGHHTAVQIGALPTKPSGVAREGSWADRGSSHAATIIRGCVMPRARLGPGIVSASPAAAVSPPWFKEAVSTRMRVSTTSTREGYTGGKVRR